MLTTILSCLGWALLDSLNPFSIAAMILVTANQRSLKNPIVFIAGTFLTYFTGGVLVSYGLHTFLFKFTKSLPESIKTLSYLVLGVGCIAVAAYLWKQESKTNSKLNNSSFLRNAWTVFLFAGASTFADFTSAVPYFAALYQINDSEHFSHFLNISLNFTYNVIYVLPLVAVSIVNWYWASASKIFGQINSGIQWVNRRLLPVILALCGVFAL